MQIIQPLCERLETIPLASHRPKSHLMYQLLISIKPYAGLTRILPTERITHDCRQAKLCPEVLVKDKSGATSSSQAHRLGGIRQLVFSSHPAIGVETAFHDAAGSRVCAVG